MTVDRNTDLASHHIEGWRPDTGAISIPLISHITGNLWVGGCIDGVRLPDDFRFVVSLYPWEKYVLGPNTDRVEVALYDSTEMADEEALLSTARTVNDCLAIGKTLVHCQAGLNRSNLIAALTLSLTGEMSTAQAIALMREKRAKICLCNEVFEEWLLKR